MLGKKLHLAVSLAVLVAALLASSPSASAQAPEQTAATSPRLTLDRLYSLPHLIGNKPTGFAWSRDGGRLAFLWNDEGGNFRDVWLLNVDDPELQPQRVTQMPSRQARSHIRPGPKKRRPPSDWSEIQVW